MNDDVEKELSTLRDQAAGFRARIDEANADILSAKTADDRAKAKSALKESLAGLSDTLKEIQKLMNS